LPTLNRTTKHAADALLLIDFMNLFDFKGARALAPRAIRAARATASLKARANQREVPCIFVNDNFGAWTRSFEQLVQTCIGRGGASETIAHLLEPTAADISILKPRHSAFYGTPLEFLLDELEVTRLVIAGIAADNCVFATAQDAHVRKFKVWIPSNCVAAESPANEQSVLRHMARTLKGETHRYEEPK
jgi:nicotinamidase-related amidase